MTIDEMNRLEKRHLWHPCSQMKDYEEFPAVPIAKGEGVWLTTHDGRRILDAVSSWWVNLFGHGNQRIAEAIAHQAGELEHVIFANYTHEPAVKLASHLAGLFHGKLPRVFYTDNGSSAIEAALKLSYQYHHNAGKQDKKEFVYISGAYHGETIGALSMSSLSLYKKVFEPLLVKSREVEGPDCLRCPFGKTRTTCSAECSVYAEKFFEEHHRSISAVIIEPMVQCAAGMQIYSPQYLVKLRAITEKLGIHLICDEIASGFARTGQMMASHHAGITPDIVCVSKGITGGFLPLAAVLTSDQIYDAFYADYLENKAFLHSHSYTGNPISCRAACTVFDIFNEKDWLSEINSKGELIRNGVSDLLDHPNVAEIRSIGMITAIELAADRKTLQGFDPSLRTGYRIYRQAEKNGVLLRNLGDIIYFMPPYVISEDEIAFMTNTAVTAIKTILSKQE